MQEQCRAADQLRRGGAGVPAERQRKTDAEHARERDAVREPRRPHREAGEAGKQSGCGGGNRQAVGGGEPRFPDILPQQAGQRAIEHVETVQPDRDRRGHQPDEQRRDQRSGCRRTGAGITDPGAEESTADPDEQPDIEREPGRPERRSHARAGGRLRRRLLGRRADRENQRAAYRVSVRRGHPPAQHVGTRRQRRIACDHDGRILDLHRVRREREAGRQDQPDHQRHDRLVEGQPQRGRRRSQDRAVRRLGLDQPGMRQRRRGSDQRREQGNDDGDRPHGHGRITASAAA